MRPAATILVLLLFMRPLRADEQKPRVEIPLGGLGATSLEYSPDGKRLAVVSAKYRQLPIALRLPLMVFSSPGPPPDGWYDHRLSLWEIAPVRKVGDWELGDGETHAFSADWKTVAVVRVNGWEHNVRVWDLSAEKIVKRLDADFDDRFGDRFGQSCVVGVSADGNVVATANEFLHIWDLRADRKKPKRIDLKAEHVYGITVHPDGKLVATATAKLTALMRSSPRPDPGTVRVWVSATGKEAFRADEGDFVAAFPEFTTDGKELKYVTVGPVRKAADDNASDWFYDEYKVRRCTVDVATRRRTVVKEESAKGDKSFAALMPLLMKGFSASSEGKVRFHVDSNGEDVVVTRMADEQRLGSFRPHGGKHHHPTLAASPDGKSLATGANDVRIWDVAEVVASFNAKTPGEPKDGRKQ